jgi:hypothetical protein
MQEATFRRDRSWLRTLIDMVNRKQPSSVMDTPTAGDNTHVLNLVELVMFFAFRLFGFSFD